MNFPIDKNSLIERIHGSLMGVAVGDAMGMPTSMLDRDRIKALFPGGIHDFLPAPENHPIHNGMVAGQVTDDTQQTLVIADSILEAGKVDPELIARKLLLWAESFNAFSSSLLGPSSMRALQAFQAGASIEKTGAYGDTNGASMRIAPVGIINLGDVEGTVRDVALACKPTHNTNIAIAGASAIACALGACVRDVGLQHARFAPHAAHGVHDLAVGLFLREQENIKPAGADQVMGGDAGGQREAETARRVELGDDRVQRQ